MVVHNKSDLTPVTEELRKKVRELTGTEVAEYSALNPEKFNPALLSMIREAMPASALKSHGLIGDLVKPGDIVLLITPVDIEAPEGRLILPQVQVAVDKRADGLRVAHLQLGRATGYQRPEVGCA